MGFRATAQLLFLLSFFASGIHLNLSATDPGDAAELQSLKSHWQNTPPSWDQTEDPCGAPWVGVTCNNSRITSLKLPCMSLAGNLSDRIGGLTELRSLDLSFNPNVTGSLTPRLGDLKNLKILILAGCGFSGSIPDELGNLAELSFLALNSNILSGRIPASLGKLSKLYWLDLAENQLTGTIPISKNSSPGLDQLLNAKHFHFNRNQLSGFIPPELFSSDMMLIHVLFDGNRLEGEIPSTLGLVQTRGSVSENCPGFVFLVASSIRTDIIHFVCRSRLNRNALSGEVLKNLNNLTNLNELNLANNKLTGPLPDLTKMDSLRYVDLSNNSFDSSESSDWFSTLPSLTTLVIENGPLQGTLTSKVFSFPYIQQVLLRNNAFNGTFDLDDSFSPQLQLVDLQNNQISAVTLSADYKNKLILVGNPVCTGLPNVSFCQP
ncbi:hypothetical protein POPTR_008G125600v4 [Populus trichocarpa]|uniref:Uncharacterized protein n=1 Tax=Populus trichocarpa TaxID=3694 RepID=A0ACC0SL94_POPTR|nr:hypothetical protein POPTR_008G125600v4 [Populus trichocarpa]